MQFDFFITFLVGLLISVPFVFFFGKSRIGKMCLVAYYIYLLPPFLSFTLPYAYGYGYKISIGLTVLGLTATLLFVPLLASKCPDPSFKPLRLSKPFHFLGWVGVGLFLIELVINPVIATSGDMESRREMLSVATPIYTVATLLSGIVLYNLAVGALAPTLAEALRASSSWFAYSMLALYTGNRQFIFIGILLLAMSLLFRWNSLGKLFRYGAIPLAAMLIVLFSVQYIRGSRTAGRQDKFFMDLFNISFSRPSLVENSYILNTLGTTMFAYYGTQYNFFNFIITEDIRNGYPLANTFPLLYRRIDGPLNLPNAEIIRLNRLDENFSILGFFPRSWGMMWMNMYLEFGWFSVFSFTLGGMGSLYYSFKFVARSRGAGLLPVVCLTCVAFGINFFIFLENAAYLLVLSAVFAVGLKRDEDCRSSRRTPLK